LHERRIDKGNCRMGLVLGIDGGGTRTRVAIAEGERVVAHVEGGSIKRLRVGAEVAEEKLAVSCDAFCDDHAFTVDEARVVMRAAKQFGLKLRIHAEQFRTGTGAALAAEL